MQLILLLLFFHNPDSNILSHKQIGFLDCPFSPIQLKFITNNIVKFWCLRIGFDFVMISLLVSRKLRIDVAKFTYESTLHPNIYSEISIRLVHYPLSVQIRKTWNNRLLKH